MKKRLNKKLIMAVVVLAMLAGAVLSGCGESGTYATQKNFITIGCVCPLTGELASYGEGTLETEEAAVAEINENEGIYIDTLQRKLKIRFLVEDSESTAQGAKEAAEHLINEENVDLVISGSGAETAIAVAGVCESAKVPFFSVDAENGAWLESGSYQYCFNCSYDNESRLKALKDVFEEQGITSVGFMAVRSEESEDFAETLATFASENGLKITNPGYLDPDTPNYSAAAKALASAKVQAVICFMEADEFSALWATEDMKSFAPQMSVLVNNHLFVNDIADITHGIDIKEFYTVTSWDKKYPFESSLTDEDGSVLGLWWEDTFLSSSSELLGYKHGNVEIAIDAVKLAMALDAEDVISAAGSMNVDTVLGVVDFDQTNTCVLPCSILKWTYNTATLSWEKELASHTQLKDVEFDED